MNNQAMHTTYICVGRTGTGKSSLCNQILGRNQFIESDSSTSVTSAPQLAQSFNHSFTVVDTPGVMDTSVNSEEAKKKSCDEMIQAMGQCPEDGKRALLLVLKYGDRFTGETRKCVDIIETIFGDQCLERCCIVVFTHGEAFDINNEETNISFENWFQRQHGDLGLLLQRCEYRCLLFRNKTRDLEVRRQQIESLIRMTDILDESHTQEKFEAARYKHKRLILESQLPELLQNYDLQLNELKEKANCNLVQNQTIEELSSFKREAKEILLKLQSEDEGVYYREGELSLFHQQTLQAKQIVKQIHIQQISKLKLELTTSINMFKLKIQTSELSSTLDQLEDEMKQFFARFTDFGLIIDRDNKTDTVNITVDFERDGIINQQEDIQHFENVKIFIKELYNVMTEKRNYLRERMTEDESKRKIRVLRRKLISISASETNSELVENVLQEATELLNTVLPCRALGNLIEQLKDIEDEARLKKEQCERNKQNAILDSVFGIVSGAVGLAGSAASLSKHAVAKGISRIVPGITSISRSTFDLIRKAKR
ncbi:AIG protein [Biomphalaria glabrata]|nr:AIG protein [Biomphalaria glabrata]